MKKLYILIWIIFIYSTYMVFGMNPSTIWYDLILFASYSLIWLLLIIDIWLKTRKIKPFTKEVLIHLMIFLLWFILADLIHYNYEYYMYNFTIFIIILISYKNILKITPRPPRQ